MITIININYKGRLVNKLKECEFLGISSPQMIIRESMDLEHPCRLIIFKSGKCRIMGCKKPLPHRLNMCFPTFTVIIQKIQSITVSLDIGRSLNLITLAHCLPPGSYIFEAELFPALRLMGRQFLPHCVNVFASGKIMILGIHSLANVNKLCQRILNYINMVYVKS
jgi:TATA-box binding protein (TBP) (component of TFIID and TFIIIB)